MMSCVYHLSGMPPGSCRLCPISVFLGKRVQRLGCQEGLGPHHLWVWQNTAHKHVQGQSSWEHGAGASGRILHSHALPLSRMRCAACHARVLAQMVVCLQHGRVRAGVFSILMRVRSMKCPALDQALANWSLSCC